MVKTVREWMKATNTKTHSVAEILWGSLDVITSHLLELALSLVSGLLEVITGP